MVQSTVWPVSQVVYVQLIVFTLEYCAFIFGLHSHPRQINEKNPEIDTQTCLFSLFCSGSNIRDCENKGEKTRFVCKIPFFSVSGGVECK